MKRLGKKIASAALALTLTVSMASSCFGATWGSYFGANEAWPEAAMGTLKTNTPSGFNAVLDVIGWGGVWGCQVFQKTSVKKDDTLHVKFDIKGTNIKKWVYVKIAKKDDATGAEHTAAAFWTQTIPGKTIKIDKVMKSKDIADRFTFGLGGEMGDRQGSDIDAEYRYSLIPDFDHSFIPDEDATMGTDITVSGFKYGIISKATSNKKTNLKNLNKYLKDGGSFTVKKSGYKVTLSASGSKVAILAKKGSKKVVNFKVASSKLKKFKKKFNKGKAKKARTAVDKVLKAKSGLTLKNIGLK